MDTQLLVVAPHALACVTSAFNANPNPPQNYGYRVEYEPPAEIWPDDICCEGLGYVSIGDVWPSVDSFPDADIIRQVRGNCPPAAWGVQFRLGIMRCTVADIQPTQAEEDAAFIQDLYDIDALMTAACCFRTYFTTDPQWLGYNVVIERMNKTIQGGCKDRYVPISIQLPNCVC